MLRGGGKEKSKSLGYFEDENMCVSGKRWRTLGS